MEIYYVAENTSNSAVDLLIFILPLIAFAGIILIRLKMADNMARIAADKGYHEKKWWHYVLWLGIIGILMICAMPDKKGREEKELPVQQIVEEDPPETLE